MFFFFFTESNGVGGVGVEEIGVTGDSAGVPTAGLSINDKEIKAQT